MTYSEWEEGDRQRREAAEAAHERRQVEPMYELIGKRVLRVLVNRERDVMVFEVDQPPQFIDFEIIKANPFIAFEAETTMGEAWFADVTGLDELRGHVVRSCEYIDIQGREDERSRTDNEDFYGVRLQTDAGTTDIIFRCSYSGMSYGGSIQGVVEVPEDLTELVGDEWSA